MSKIFGDEKPVSLFLSLGSGHQSPTPGSKTCLKRITRESGIVERELSHQLGGAAAYLRLNVDKGLEAIETTQWSDVSAIISHTRVYLEMTIITSFIDEAVHRVLEATGSITLGQLVGTSSSTKIRFDSQELGDLLERRLRPMHDALEVIVEKITLVDAIGNRIPIPLHLCCSYKMLTSIIHSYFEHHRPPGTELVRQGHYQLVCGTQKEDIDSSKWTFLAAPGLTVEMSMVRHNRDKRDMACPKCARVCYERINEIWATCLPCNAQFRITSKIESNDNLISPAAGKSPKHHNGNNIGDEGEGASLVNNLAGNEVDEWKRFRLITVVNLLRPGWYRPQSEVSSRRPPQDTPINLLPLLFTTDVTIKETQYLLRMCFNCENTEPPSWRRSTLNPGKIVCNKCGLYERTHNKPRPYKVGLLPGWQQPGAQEITPGAWNL